MSRSSFPSNELVRRRAPLLGGVPWSEFPRVTAPTARSDLSTPDRLESPLAASFLSPDRASRLHPRFLGDPCVRAAFFDPGWRMPSSPWRSALLVAHLGIACRLRRPPTAWLQPRGYFGTRSRGPHARCLRFVTTVAR